MLGKNSRITQAVKLAACAAVLSAVVSAPADAQDPARGDTVRDRVRPGYDSLGVRAGGFLVFPAVATGLQYDNNIYGGARDEAGDFVSSIGPQVDAISRWSNHELQLGANVSARRHAERRKENATDWLVYADGRLDIIRNASLSLRLSAAELHEARNDPNSAFLAEPLSYVRRSAELRLFYRLNRASVTLGGSVADLSFDGRMPVGSGSAPFRHSERDRDEFTLAVRGGYMILPGYEAFVRVAHGQRRYQHPLSFGFDRDSRGLEVTAGAALDLGGIVSGEVFAGYVRRDWGDARLPDIEEPTLGGSVDWNVTRLTTVSASLERTVEESTLNASGYLSTRARTSMDHELQRNLILSAELIATNDSYEGVTDRDDREYDIADVGLGATWLMNARLHVDLWHRFTARDSSLANDDSEKHVTTLTLRFQY